MIARAQARFIRITPRKFRQIIPLIKGKNPEVAIAILTNVNKRASQYAIELLKSVIANAKRIQGVDLANLYISELRADGGPMLKRYRAASMGRATMVRKRMSHLMVELDALSHEKGSMSKEAKRREEGVQTETPRSEPKKVKVDRAKLSSEVKSKKRVKQAAK